jgi:hypothetical protein
MVDTFEQAQDELLASWQQWAGVRDAWKKPRRRKAPGLLGGEAVSFHDRQTDMLNRERLFSRLRSRLATAASHAVSPRAEPPRYSIIGSALSRHAG